MKFHVYKDMVKIVKQLLGQSNMFGYKTTMANQLYMWYCFLGRIYTIDELHWHTKLLWLCSHLSSIAIAIPTFVLYLMDGTDEGILMLLYVLFIAFVVAFTDIMAPWLAFLHRHRIESAIQLVDKIVSKKTRTVGEVDNQYRLRNITIYTILAFWVPVILFTWVCTLDMALFYDESKTKNFIYYLLPLPNLEQYGSAEFYVTYNSTVILCTPGIYIIYTVIMVTPVLLTAMCHNEVQRIVHQLNSLSQATTLESYQVVELRFKETLVKCLLDYRDVISVVRHFRGFYETLAGITLPTVLLVEIVHAFIFLSPGYPYVVKMRELSIFCATITPVFFFCWIGETLEEMTSTMSFAVYSTPWYWSTRMRKDVYLFLCEAQHSINATAWGVYPLLMRTFLCFMNAVQSSVNVLRTTTANR